MRSKLAVLLTTVPCIVIFIASALAQTPRSRPAREATDLIKPVDPNPVAVEPAAQTRAEPVFVQRPGMTMVPALDAAASDGGGVASSEDLEIATHVDALLRQLSDAKADNDKDKVKKHL